MRVLAILLLLGSIAVASDDVYKGSSYLHLQQPQDTSLSINVAKDGISNPIVTIKPDGTIEYGKGYTPDAAAKALWDAVGLERKERNCK